MLKKKSSKRLKGPLALHARYVANVKEALAKVLKKQGRQIASSQLPIVHGMRRLSISCPPMLEEAFGYRGKLRFVAFHYSPPSGRVVHSDGGDDLPIPNPNDWITFVNHPAICAEVHYCTTMFGRVGINRMLTAEEFTQLPLQQRSHYCERFHALVVDRVDRHLYVATWKQLKLFQPCAEPDGEEVHVMTPGGKLLSPGNEYYDDLVDPSIVDALWGHLNNELGNPNTLERLAAWYVSEGQPEEGRQLLQNVLNSYPERTSSASFQYVVAFLSEETHEYAAAVCALEKYVAQCPHVEASVHLRLGQLYLQVNRYEAAIRELEEVKKASESPQHEAAPEISIDEAWYVMLARAYVGLGDLKKGIQLCKEGIDRSASENEGSETDTGEIYVQLAEISGLQGNYAEASDYCRHAMVQSLYDLDEFSAQPIAVYRVGWWFSLEARIANAARVFSIVDEAPWIKDLAFGYLYLGMNRYRDAVARLQRVYKEKKSAEVLWLLGIAHLAAKQLVDAKELFEELIADFQTDERGHVGMALLHITEGANHAAEDDCKAALARNQNSGETQAVLSYLYWSDENYIAASQAFEKAKQGGFSPHYKLALPPEEDGKDVRFMILGQGSTGGYISSL